MKQELLPPSLEFSAKRRWKRMNKIFLFFSFTHGNGGGNNHTLFFLFSSYSLSLFYAHAPYFIFFHPWCTNTTCLWHVLPITLGLPCLSWPATTSRGEFDMQVPPLSTCTNRSSHIDLSHFRIFSHKSYWLNSHEINQIEAWNFHTFIITYSRQ